MIVVRSKAWVRKALGIKRPRRSCGRFGHGYGKSTLVIFLAVSCVPRQPVLVVVLRQRTSPVGIKLRVVAAPVHFLVS